jgi:hypothetical protein
VSSALPSIATLYAEILPETSKISAGLTAAFRKVDPEAREAGRRWSREIQQGMSGVDVELDADTAKAEEKIDKATRDRKTKTEVVPPDTKKTEEDLDKATRDRKTKVKLDIDQSEWSRLTSMIAKGDRDHAAAMSGFLRARRDFASTKFSDPLDYADSLLKVQGAGAALSASLAGAGANAASSVGGALSSAMGPVGSALTVALVGGAVVAAAGVAAALSGAIGLIPAGLGGGVAVLGTLVTGLDGVKDAWDAAGKAADSANKDGAEKAKAVASAQKTLRDAVMDEVTAQKDVANARKDARQQLEDLNVQLRGGVIDEKSAILDAQAARRDLATGRFKDSIEYQQAQLRVQQADQRVLEAHERNVQLQQKATDANGKGVEQSDQVVAANQRLAKAHDDVATAQQNLATTQNKPSSSAEALATAMGKLSPVAQGFIQTLEGLKPAWNQLKFAVQDSLFAGLGPQIQSLATQYLPVLQTAMTGLAGTMNSAFKDVGAWLSKPETMATIQQIVANIGSSFQVWSQSLVPFSQAFLTITQVGAGFLPSLGKVITDGANAFNNFIQSAARSGELQQWMRTGIEAMAQLMKMLPVLGKMFLDLAPMAIPFLQMLNNLLPMVEPVFRVLGVIAERFFTGFNKFLNSAKGWVGDFVGTIKELGEVFGRVWGAISGAIDKAWKIIGPILQNFKELLIHLDPTGILGKLADLANKLPGGDKTVSGTPTAAPSGAAPSTPTPDSSGGLFGGSGTFGFGGGSGIAGGSWFGSGQTASPMDTHLTQALAAKGFSPALIDLIQGFSKVEGNNRFGIPTLGFTDGQLGGAGDLQSHVNALAKQIADRSSVAGPFPEAGSKEQQAQWIAKVVGQSGLSSDWQGNAQPQDYVQRVMGAMGGTSSAMPSLGAGASALPPGWHPNASSAAPSGLQTGGGDAGLLSGVPAGTYLQTQAADLTKGIGDCSSAVEDLINMMDGVSTAGRGMSTQNASQWLAAHGFMPTDKLVPGAFNVGFNDHHMQATLPGGTPFNWGSDAAAAQRGIGGTGAFDPAFTSHYYRPGGMYPSAAGMPTIASPQGVSPDGSPLGTQQSPMYVQNAQGPSGQQLGQDFISGIGEMFGLDGSLFKNPMDTGLFKGFKGAMGFFTGLMGGGKGGGQGLPASAWAAQGGDGAALPAMGGGDMLSGLGGMLQGIMPQPFGQTTRGGPMQAPSEFQPMLPGSGGNTGMPSNFLAPGQGETPTGGGHKIDNSTTYVLNGTPPPGSHDFINGLNVPRARQGLTGLPK